MNDLESKQIGYFDQLAVAKGPRHGADLGHHQYFRFPLLESRVSTR